MAAPPGQRRGPAPTPIGSGPTVDSAPTKEHVSSQGTADHPQDALRHVWAETIEVAGKDRPYLVLVVWCSGAEGCGERHLHHAQVGDATATRRPACGRASYVVHTGYALSELNRVAS